MQEFETSKTSDMIASIASAYASRSDVSVDDILNLVQKLRTEFSQSAGPAHTVVTTTSDMDVEPDIRQTARPAPALAIADAVTREKVFCLCCGKGFKMLKRHLGSEHNLSEDAYRELFDLPNDMPLVAPSYSERKAAYAMRMGFGKYDRTSGETAGTSLSVDG